MSEYAPLLKKESYIIPPNIDLTKNIAITRINKCKSKCEKCGKALQFPYYLLIGIPPSPSIIDAHKCKNIGDEEDHVEMIIDMVRFEANDFDIDNQHQWIFSDQNILNSRTRICVDCFEEYKEPFELKDIHFIAIRIRTVYFAVMEYQRRHTPIDSAKSECERYRISLPDRSMVALIGPGEPGWGFWLDADANRGGETLRFADFLNIALIHDYDTSKTLLGHDYANSVLQELRADFIQDRNRLVPNDQELTRWMKKYYGDPDDYSWIKAIEFCKVLANPRTRTSCAGDHVFKTKYSVFVHYIDKDWEEYYI